MSERKSTSWDTLVLLSVSDTHHLPVRPTSNGQGPQLKFTLVCRLWMILYSGTWIHQSFKLIITSFFHRDDHSILIIRVHLKIKGLKNQSKLHSEKIGIMYMTRKWKDDYTIKIFSNLRLIYSRKKEKKEKISSDTTSTPGLSTYPGTSTF